VGAAVERQSILPLGRIDPIYSIPRKRRAPDQYSSAPTRTIQMRRFARRASIWRRRRQP